MGLADGIFQMAQSVPTPQPSADAGDVRRSLTGLVPVVLGNLMGTPAKPPESQQMAAAAQPLPPAPNVNAMIQPPAQQAPPMNGQDMANAIAQQPPNSMPSLAPHNPTLGDRFKKFGSQFAMNLGDYLVQRGGGADPRFAQNAATNNLAMLNAQSEADYRRGQLQIANRDQARKERMVTFRGADGTVYEVPQSQYASVLRGQASDQAKIDVEKLRDKNRMEVLGTQEKMKSGEISHWQPVTDEKTGKPIMRGFNKQGQQVTDVDNAFFPQLAQSVSSTVEYKDDGKGGYVALPKTTVTSKVQPGTSGGASRSGVPAQPQARTVLGPDGTPLHSSKANDMVQWTNPETGQNEAGPLGSAPPGASPIKLPAKEQVDIQNARQAVNLMVKTGDPAKPETQGVIQLINSLDKDGKLGVFASRYNDMVTKGVGASPQDDPRIITLLNKNMLGQTATMLAHFGASGGRSPAMLQHFLDMANAGKMDAVTLKAGTLAIADYMKDRAMIPAPSKTNLGNKTTQQAPTKDHSDIGFVPR